MVYPLSGSNVPVRISFTDHFVQIGTRIQFYFVFYLFSAAKCFWTFEESLSDVVRLVANMARLLYCQAHLWIGLRWLLKLGEGQSSCPHIHRCTCSVEVLPLIDFAVTLLKILTKIWNVACSFTFFNWWKLHNWTTLVCSSPAQFTSWVCGSKLEVACYKFLFLP